MSPHVRFVYFLATTVIEFALIITLVAGFAYASQGQYRSKLWEDGGIHGWNSDPRQRVYYYANYQEPPPVPLIWDEESHRYHLWISLTTGVIFMARIRTQVWGLDLVGKMCTTALYDLLLVALWSYSVFLQNSGDVSDPQHLSLRPWYLEHGCGQGSPETSGACSAVRRLFFLTLFTLMWCCLRFLCVCLYITYLAGFSSGLRTERKVRAPDRTGRF
ncbi:hypothetical protein DE146DRAFT_661866 [Phaeosphaeria sp. MPI-PUGE-AT-0046c]|nr:hypothetical protein DE146DRAFT_661866 [Phaeosphaeria sp. MPI-PUGE-AT-0046c]